MCLLGVEVISGDKSVLKNLTEGWYPFFRCDELKTPPKDKVIITLPLSEDFYNITKNDRPSVRISCVLGENGSGKSTLFELIYRIMNDVAIYFNKLPLELEYAAGINATLYYEQEGKIGFIHINSYKDDGTDDCVRFAGEYNEKLLCSLADCELKELEKIFYVVVTNYSIYSFNPDDYYLASGDENFYLRNIFDKNDAYITPLVVLPYRNGAGIIDIDNERKLAEQRISALSIYLYLNYRNCLVGEKSPLIIEYNFLRNAEKKYSAKVEDSDTYNVLKGGWIDYLKENNIELKDKDVQAAAVAYLAYKSLKIQQNYPLTYDSESFSIFNLDDHKNILTNLIRKLLDDKSHIVYQRTFLIIKYQLLSMSY